MEKPQNYDTLPTEARTAWMQERARRDIWQINFDDGIYNTGTPDKRRKLTDIQIAQIRQEYAAGGTTQAGLAGKYGVSPLTVFNIVHEHIHKT